MINGSDNSLHVRERLNEHSIAIEKIRDSNYQLASSVASMSSAMITITKNIDTVIKIQEKHSEELGKLNEKFRDVNFVKKIVTSPVTFWIVFYLLFTYEKGDISRFFGYIKAFF